MTTRGNNTSDLAPSFRTVDVVGVPVTIASCSAIVQRALEAVEQRRRMLISTANAYSLVVAQEEESFLRHFYDADIVLPDGALVAGLGRILGTSSMRKISGYMFFRAFATEACRRGLSAFFLGSTKATLSRIRQRMSTLYPGFHVCGTATPSFGSIPDRENVRLVELVNRSRPDILFVGMTAPKQELWLSRNRDQLEVPVAMGIGAVFEFLAGTKSAAPDWLAHAGGEWIYRWAQEPRRLSKRVIAQLGIVPIALRYHWLGRR